MQRSMALGVSLILSNGDGPFGSCEKSVDSSPPFMSVVESEKEIVRIMRWN